MFVGYHKKEFIKMALGTIVMLALGYAFTLGFFLLFQV
jgi:succinate dehydrogenase hydrophobic anchor subunit